MAEKESIIPPHGGYRKLKSYQIAQLIFDRRIRSRGDERLISSGRMLVQTMLAPIWLLCQALPRTVERIRIKAE